MRIFILEDSPERMRLFHEVLGYDVTASTTVEGAQKKFEPPYDLILLDHDLEEEHYLQAPDGGFYGNLSTTGTEFARWLAATQQPRGRVIIHSYNPEGAKRMFQILLTAGWVVAREPFGSTLLKTLQSLMTESTQSDASPSPQIDLP